MLWPSGGFWEGTTGKVLRGARSQPPWHVLGVSEQPSGAPAGIWPWRYHIGLMRTHPYAEATYRIVCLPDGAFGVEVDVPDRSPATVTSFDTEAAAEDWIARNKQRVIEQTGLKPRFRGSWPRR